MRTFIRQYNNMYTNIELKGLANSFDDHKVKTLDT